MLDIYTKKREVLIKYLGCLNRHLWRKVTLFKPMKINEACVQAQYMENMGMTKVQLSGSKNKGNQDASKEKKKWKGEDKNTTTTTNQCKDPNNHFNHCNIDGPTKYKYWKLHPNVNP